MHHLTRPFFKTLVLGTICAAAASFPADTLACSPPAPGLSSHIPANDAWYPANGIVLLDGFGISISDFTVTVDGAPATLVDASSAFASSVAAVEARISPKPNADQKVTISGPTCAGCTPETFTFTARVDDLVAPEGVVSAHYSVHDYADFKSSGGDCQSDSDMALWVHVQTTPASEEEAPAVLEIEAFADKAMTQNIGKWSSVITTNETVWGYRVTTAALQGTAPTNVCFRLSTKDLSGNSAADPTILCNACYLRTDSQSMTNGFPPDEPMFGEADTIKGGPCDWGAGVGGGTDDQGSCSYQPGSSRASTTWFLLACSVLGFGAARKRARRTSK